MEHHFISFQFISILDEIYSFKLIHVWLIGNCIFRICITTRSNITLRNKKKKNRKKECSFLNLIFRSHRFLTRPQLYQLPLVNSSYCTIKITRTLLKTKLLPPTHYFVQYPEKKNASRLSSQLINQTLVSQ